MVTYFTHILQTVADEKWKGPGFPEKADLNVR